MSLFNIFSKNRPRFVADGAHEANRAKQAKMAPLTMAQLRKHGVTNEISLKLEFFFYSNAESKASALVAALNSRGYLAKHGPSAKNRSIQIVNGWTTQLKMEDSVVVEWTKEMCDVGFANDCEFDGWGTNPKQ